MNKKLIGISIIVIGLIALLAIIYFLFFFGSSPEEITDPEEKEQPITNNLPVIEEEEKTETRRAVININERPQVEEVTEGDLKQIAMSFVERLGSYSNQSNYANIQELKLFMSSSMKRWADNYIKEEKMKSADYTIYYGMITKAVSGNIENFDDDTGRAEIVIGTQRRMATGTMANVVSYQQNIVVKFIREGGAWKVDSAEWEEDIMN